MIAKIADDAWAPIPYFLETLIATDTLRRGFPGVPGRLTCSARRLTLHLPQRWPGAERFGEALANLWAVPLVT